MESHGSADVDQRLINSKGGKSLVVQYICWVDHSEHHQTLWAYFPATSLLAHSVIYWCTDIQFILPVESWSGERRKICEEIITQRDWFWRWGLQAHTHTHTITGTNVHSGNVQTQWWSQTWWEGLAKLNKCNHCDQSGSDIHWNVVYYYPSFRLLSIYLSTVCFFYCLSLHASSYFILSLFISCTWLLTFL